MLVQKIYLGNMEARAPVKTMLIVLNKTQDLEILRIKISNNYTFFKNIEK